MKKFKKILTFIILKVIEISIVVGLYYLMCYIGYNYLDKMIFGEHLSPFWFSGIFDLMVIVVFCCILYFALYAIYGFLKWNWKIVNKIYGED